jgi:hypothetical protein
VPWVIAAGIVAALALIFIFGVGFAQQWGAPQWGPLAEWVAGTATFAAVAAALWQAVLARRASIGEPKSLVAQVLTGTVGRLTGTLNRESVGRGFEPRPPRVRDARKICHALHTPSKPTVDSLRQH